MARIVVSEPVPETRELLERLVERLGHEVVPEAALDTADALLFEPGSSHGLDLANEMRRRRPSAALVACRSLPEEPKVKPDATVTQPFAPSELQRALDDALT